MRIENFELFIGGKLYQTEDGYVGMTHGAPYTINLKNHSNLRVNAKCKVDGKSIGDFRINPYGSISLERPSNDTGQFTFYRKDSVEAVKSDLLSVDSSELGLVQVTFVPEVPPRIVKAARNVESFGMSKSLGGTRSSGGQSMGAGGTGLSGHSNQKFVQAVNIEEDWDKAIIISLRLVEDKNSPRPLTALSNSNPIPPPVG